MGRSVVMLLLLLSTLLVPAVASGKTTKDLTYDYETVWTTAIRLLRADRGYKITDKDRDSGYILFIFPGAGSEKECRASLEVVDTVDENKNRVVRLQLEIAYQPSYVELEVLDRLETKLRDERGEQPPPRPAQKKRSDPPAKPDGSDRDKQTKMAVTTGLGAMIVPTASSSQEFVYSSETLDLERSQTQLALLLGVAFGG